ncbi:hypothetical protein NDU88_005372 [Pleurodeles waltl]|uniref:Uncharacterized protein n=1 Tax=Pleurodeles waltl TaxID=8319 RepID=A0AAV7TUJ8_PLEWA|nr:hypothetical protein NDU88_005372 [Pleurodeles waltl]
MTALRVCKRLAVTIDPTNRLGPINKYPGSILNNLLSLVECANPELEGCAETLGDRNTDGGETGGRTSLKKEEEDAEPRTEGGDKQRTEETTKTATERTRCPESSVGATTKEENTNTTRHVPEGT